MNSFVRRIWLVLLISLIAGVAAAQKTEEKSDTPKDAQSEQEKTEKKQSHQEGTQEVKPSDKEEEKAEEVVVTATKTEETIKSISRAMSIVTRQDIEAQKKTSVIELLRGLPGVRVTQQGGPGTLSNSTGISLRGAKASGTLLLINGMRIQDPATPGHDYTSLLGDMLTDNLERIEILRGPASTLYGADAVGGVVNLVTRRGAGKPAFSFLFEGGSQATFKEVLSAWGGLDKLPVFHSLDYFVSGAGLTSKGIPGMHDTYANASYLHNINLNVTKDLRVGSFVSGTWARQDFMDWNSANFRPTTDPNARRRLDLVSYAFDVEHHPFDFWDYKLYYSEINTDRISRDPLNSGEAPGFYYWYKDTSDARTREFELQSNFHIGKLDTFTIGYQRQVANLTYKSVSLGDFGSTDIIRKDFSDDALFLQDQVRLFDRVFLTGGLRWDQYSNFGTAFTKSVSAAFIMPVIETKLRGSWGTAFKAPSLYQLYSPYGSPTLRPEESEGWDIGFEQPLWGKRLTADLTYLHNDFTNLIAYDYATWRYNNIGQATTDGLELGTTFAPTRRFYTRFFYTFTESENKEAGANRGKALPGVPKNMFGATLGINPWNPLNLTVTCTYMGRNIAAYATEWNPQRINRDYLKTDFAISYDVNPNLQIYARGENIFDDHIREYGFPGLGASFYGGLKLKY